MRKDETSKFPPYLCLNPVLDLRLNFHLLPKIKSTKVSKQVVMFTCIPIKEVFDERGKIQNFVIEMLSLIYL